MRKSICIVGTGGFAREVLVLIDALGRYQEVEAFLEPDHIWERNWKDREIMGKKVLPLSFADQQKHMITIGIGNNETRKKTVTQLPTNIEYISLIHPNAEISRWVELELGAIVTAGCVLTCNIRIGGFSQLNLNTTIGHDCVIDDFFTTAPGVNISGNCTIGRDVYFGGGSSTRQGISICDNVIIGMGAVVVKDITEPGTYIGIPAKKLSTVI